MRVGEHLTRVELGSKVLPLFKSHVTRWDPCEKCRIGRWINPKVHFRGSLPCQILFIGEAPGRDEAREGFPFVGASGKNLDHWLQWVVGKWIAGRRKEFPKYAIVNTCACRPTDSPTGPNRKPTDLEQANCAPKFDELLTLANPSSIVCLGAVARDYWLSRTTALVRLLPVLHLPHPSPLRVGGPESKLSLQAREELLDFINKGYGPKTDRETVHDLFSEAKT